MISTSKKKLQILKEKLCDFGYDDVIIFDDFAQAFMGVSYDNRAIYSYSKMIDILVSEGMDEMEAIEYIEYNCCNTCGDGMPIVMTFEVYNL